MYTLTVTFGSSELTIYNIFLKDILEQWCKMWSASEPSVAFQTWTNPWSGLLRQQESEGKRILGRGKTENTVLTFTIVLGHLPPPSESHYSSTQHNEISSASSQPSSQQLSTIFPYFGYEHTSFFGLFNSDYLWSSSVMIIIFSS